MYTLPSEKLMEMAKIQPHEELLSEGELKVVPGVKNLGITESQLVDWRFNHHTW